MSNCLSVSSTLSRGGSRERAKGRETGPAEHFLIFYVQAPWRSGLSDTVPEREKFLKMLGWASLAPLDPLPGVWR